MEKGKENIREKQADLLTVYNNMMKRLNSQKTKITDHVCNDEASESRQAVNDRLLDYEDGISNAVWKLYNNEEKLTDMTIEQIGAYLKRSMLNRFLDIQRSKVRLDFFNEETSDIDTIVNDDDLETIADIDLTYLHKSLYSEMRETLTVSKRIDETDLYIYDLLFQGYNLNEIANKIDLSRQAIIKRRDKVSDVLIRHGHLKDAVSRFYNGQGAQRSDIWDIKYNEASSAPSSIPLDEYRPTKSAPYPYKQTKINSSAKYQAVKMSSDKDHFKGIRHFDGTIDKREGIGSYSPLDYLKPFKFNIQASESLFYDADSDMFFI